MVHEDDEVIAFVARHPTLMGPPGVPYEQQQFHALMAENGVLDLSESDQAAVATGIRRHL